ncbi:MAG: lipoyl(octanoyl) transferase LipB [Pseudomonadota bacterium]
MAELRCRHFGRVEYADSWRWMREKIDLRAAQDHDECWLLQHTPVYTLGQAGKREHILNSAEIPVVQTDRGGQVTYHGPGQIVFYTLFDLRRLGIGVRRMVEQLERSVVATLREFGIESQGRRDAPGVYVEDRKIAALGLRVRKGCTYHGASLNVEMDLQPFLGINPCGFANMPVTDMKHEGASASIETVSDCLIASLTREFRYNSVSHAEGFD